ncbi:4-oxalomesaconate hydratase [Labedaea rhizosphaerae]|uniref:4-oxalomesaconate hydratase n=1 Tax=Labedaea rhizosphaerae TaxID=598644 RepID=A0A4R6S6H7_LABRH|nr:4-oxalomesaconate hydratase [Labedaea rhizosphaerae]
MVSAHSADFVWRAGGAIALSAKAGHPVHVVCLSYGERGESQGLWRKEGMTIEKVKQAREDEARQAADILGAEITFYDMGDYPLTPDRAAADRLVEDMRRVQPGVILTHVERDPYNLDHCFAHELALRCRMVAQAAGHPSAHPPIGAPQVLCFEPHQPEQCHFKPDLLLDITEVFDLKRAAMAAMGGAQGHLVDYYTDLGTRRGVQYRRNGGVGAEHAEAYESIFPTVATAIV